MPSRDCVGGHRRDPTDTESPSFARAPCPRGGTSRCAASVRRCIPPRRLERALLRPARAVIFPRRPLVWTARNRASITPALSSARHSGGRGAQVAQLVEHCTENAGVGGSNPPLGTTTFAECERRRQITVSAQIGRTLGTHTAKNIVLIRPFAKGRAAVRSGSRIQDVLFSAGRV